MRTQEKNGGRTARQREQPPGQGCDLGEQSPPMTAASGLLHTPFWSLQILGGPSPAPAPGLAMLPPLRSLLLALGLGLAGALNPNDPNTCSFWER